ncbi:MAG: hypothetical protein JSU79_11620 [Dehalococcoidales bacterium]|nr:MAG: hypothetical protein JSU79_11620 [Dehalococcoidales bacterium]
MATLTEVEYFKAVTFKLVYFCMTMASITGLVGYVLTWRKELPGGILLVLTGIAMSLISYQDEWFYTQAYKQDDSLIFVILFGLVYLVPGVLFIISWWMTKKEVAV